VAVWLLKRAEVSQKAVQQKAREVRKGKGEGVAEVVKVIKHAAVQRINSMPDRIQEKKATATGRQNSNCVEKKGGGRRQARLRNHKPRQQEMSRDGMLPQ